MLEQLKKIHLNKIQDYVLVLKRLQRHEDGEIHLAPSHPSYSLIKSGAAIKALTSNIIQQPPRVHQQMLNQSRKVDLPQYKTCQWQTRSQSL